MRGVFTAVRAGARELVVIAAKELGELRRQRGVLLLVVLGPFLVLAAFGIGYRNEEIALRTVFVGPADSPYEEAIDRYSETIEEYVVPIEFTSDLLAAATDLRNGRIDLVIVLPPAPIDNIEEGRQSEVAVLHDSIDPIKQIGIEFATEIAVRELNASVVTAALDAAINAGAEVDRSSAQLVPLVDELEQSVEAGDDARTREVAGELQSRLERLGPSLDLLVRTDPDGEGRETSALITSLDERLDRVADRADLGPSDLDEIRSETQRVQDDVTFVLGLEPEVLARPFHGDAESLVRERVAPEDHVAPGATALLLQHLAVSLAALSLVRDTRRGLFTEYRVGPTSAFSMMLGKILALSLVGLLAAGALIAAETLLLDVPMRGSFVHLATVSVLAVVASVTAGLVLAALGRTELMASQAAMILLLVALFFSGFIVDVEQLRQPLRALGLFAPATPAVEGLRVIQLRGVAPTGGVYLALGTHVLTGVVVAWLLLRRRWKEAL